MADGAKLELDHYESINLAAVLDAIAPMGETGLSPLCVANTGDWLGQIRWRLAEQGYTRDMVAESVGYPGPNARPQDLAERARRSTLR